MIVKAIRWVGIHTEHLEEMRAFAADVLGLQVVNETDQFVETLAANGDRVELFASSWDEKQFPTARNVVGFLVDDMDAARRELVASGVELVGDLHVLENGYAWQRFRGPDGQEYELTRDPSF